MLRRVTKGLRLRLFYLHVDVDPQRSLTHLLHLCKIHRGLLVGALGGDVLAGGFTTGVLEGSVLGAGQLLSQSTNCLIGRQLA